MSGAVAAPTRTGAATSAYGLASQLLTALTNVATAYIASLALDPASFGVFVLAFAGVSLVIATGRGLIGSTLLTHLPGVAPADRPALLRSVSGFTAGVGLVAGLVLLAAAPAFPVLVWFAPWMVFALVQDAGRHVFLADGRTRDAFTIDAAWALVQAAVLLVWWTAAGAVPLVGLATAWGAGALGGVIALVALTGATLRPGRPAVWAHATRDVAGWFTALSVLGQVELYAVLTVTGALLGTADAGGLRAVQLLVFQPPMVLLGAMLSLMVPGFARLRSGDPAARTLWRSRFLLVLPVSAGVLLVAALAGPLMALLFPQYVAYTALVLPVALQSALMGLLLPTLALLTGTRRGRTAFVLHVGRTAAIVVGLPVGVAVAGAGGLAWSLAVSGALVAVLTTLVGARLLRTGARP